MEGPEIHGPDLHEVMIVTPPGTFVLIVDKSGEWKLFPLDKADRLEVSLYGEETPWSVSLPGFNAAAAAIERYAKDGDPSGLRRLDSD